MKLHLTIAVVLGCLLTLAGCSSRKPPTASVPPASREPLVLVTDGETQPASASSDRAFPNELELIGERVTVPPLAPGKSVDAFVPAVSEQEQQATQAPHRPPNRRRLGSTARPPETEQALEPDDTAGESRPPSLKPMMSDQERQQLLNQTQANLERARRNLAGIQENRLETNERDALRQARSFLARAEQLQVADPALASSMAERAAILSQELLRRQR
jgi:hypothetical protein